MVLAPRGQIGCDVNSVGVALTVFPGRPNEASIRSHEALIKSSSVVLVNLKLLASAGEGYVNVIPAFASSTPSWPIPASVMRYHLSGVR